MVQKNSKYKNSQLKIGFINFLSLNRNKIFEIKANTEIFNVIKE